VIIFKMPPCEEHEILKTTTKSLSSISMWATIAQTIWRLATTWKVWGSNPGGDEIFRTRSDRPWSPYNRVSFPGVKRPKRGVKHPPPSGTEVEERVEPYLYSPSGLSWPVLDRILDCSLSLFQCSRVLPEKLTVPQLVKEFPAFYRNAEVHYRIHNNLQLLLIFITANGHKLLKGR
jgi:hypothetical protein